MPAELPVAGVSSVAFRIRDGASIDAGSRFFMQYSGAAPSAAQQTSSAAGVEAAWASNLAAITSNAENLEEVVVTDLSSDTGARGVWTGSTAGARSGGSQLQASICALILHTTTRRYRGGKPRTYLRAGLSNDLTGTNEWSAGTITAFTAAWEGFISDVKAISGATYTNIVNINRLGPPWTYPLNPSGRPIARGTRIDPPGVYPITASLLATKLGSQRRRLNI